MKSLLAGLGIGALTVLLALGFAWGSGLVHLGSMGSAGDTAGDVVDHSQHDTGAMTGMEAEPEEAVDHSQHDMSTMPVAEPPPATAGSVTISPQRQRLIGMRTEIARSGELRRQVRAVGMVEYDERRVAHIHTKITGWIDQLHIDFTGKPVEQGSPLLEIYSPELVATQEEYLLALRAQDTLGASRFADVAQASRNLLASARRRLELWDITDEQINALERRGEPQTTLTLHSPISGYVLHKAAYEGQYVGPKDELFTIADLRQVWLTADVYERDIPLVAVGQQARVTLSHFPGRSFVATVDYVYPYLEPETRTLKVRFALDNRRLELKPEMFADVELDADLGVGVLIPEDAVIDTGERQVAFLVLGEDQFQPVELTVGGRFGDEIHVIAGLDEGDTIVAGAAFLVDSETKLRSALRGMAMAGHQH